MNKKSSIRFISGLHEVVGLYDGFVIDLMGVVHNGVSLFPHVVECLTALKDRGKMVVFLSNAPRRSYTTQARLDKLNLSQDLYHKIITSGEKVHHNLKNRPDEWYQRLGRRAYHIGQNKDDSLFDDNACERIMDLEGADFILNTDLVSRGQTPQDFEEILQKAQQLNLPMVCANPDLVVQIKNSIEFCAGSIAKRYEELGGEVCYHGKPYPSIYKWVKQAFPNHYRLLAIGDAFETDIKGAQNANIDSAFVTCGIHAQDLHVKYGQLPRKEDIEKLAYDHGATPNYVLPGLIF